MAIEAKIVTKNSVKTINLPDDPSDRDLMDALNCEGDLVHRADIGNWEVWKGTDSSDRTLVIGTSPYIGQLPKQRKTCTLNEIQAQNLVSSVDQLLADLASK